jgi:hypothetical protein
VGLLRTLRIPDWREELEKQFCMGLARAPPAAGSLGATAAGARCASVLCQNKIIAHGVDFP